ncbi:MAG: hypothetical protein KDA73_01440 [Rhodobacteraceae bacterium]|nr:hypothetical protein [Paracoccaceae bacterium]
MPKRLATGCCARAELAAAVLAGAVSLGDPAGAEGRSYVSAAAGQMTDNEWGELFDDWGSVRPRNAWQLAASVSREWSLARPGHIGPGFVGVEIDALGHFGEQTHLEFTLPIFYRTPRFENPLIPSFAYGAGLSFATRPSETEIARTGSSTNLLAHWFFEIEFGRASSVWRPYVRLHHRSDAWGTFDADTGSNAVLIGIRWDRSVLP